MRQLRISLDKKSVEFNNGIKVVEQKLSVKLNKKFMSEKSRLSIIQTHKLKNK